MTAETMMCSRCEGTGQVPSPGGVGNEKCACGRCGGSGIQRTTDEQVAAAKAEIHRHRMATWPSRWRCWLLRLALGRDTYNYMLRSIKNDPRTPGARLVDIVVRQDAKEVRTEADWVKRIAQLAYHLPAPELR